jgi:hypothetical protein
MQSVEKSVSYQLDRVVQEMKMQFRVNAALCV